jgi:hypothetical protein
LVLLRPCLLTAAAMTSFEQSLVLHRPTISAQPLRLTLRFYGCCPTVAPGSTLNKDLALPHGWPLSPAPWPYRQRRMIRCARPKRPVITSADTRRFLLLTSAFCCDSETPGHLFRHRPSQIVPPGARSFEYTTPPIGMPQQRA